MTPLSMYPPSGVIGDSLTLANSCDSIGAGPVNLGDSDVLVEEWAIVDRAGNDAKYAYAAANGKTNILRINRPTLGCRK